MRRLPYIVLLFVLAFNAQAQNLIPNPSFEKHTGCPTSNGQVTLCNDWTPHNTSDYFHSCGSTGFNVPDVVTGYQQAAHGDAFMGLYTYLSTNNGKEWIETQIPELQTGAIYELSMS